MAMALGRETRAIGVREREYTKAVIDLDLHIRHEEKKVRRQGGHQKTDSLRRRRSRAVRPQPSPLGRGLAARGLNFRPQRSRVSRRSAHSTKVGDCIRKTTQNILIVRKGVDNLLNLPYNTLRLAIIHQGRKQPLLQYCYERHNALNSIVVILGGVSRG